ncbi:conserved membrane protein of unknown function [Candidatus Filomicrobium marinum]|uniref:Probable membrane transporter protein n=2 Tax=Filomicrobium TaxID=119044 RepID=A0A0D6JCB5_9HYPH|nr:MULTISPECIES: sulfite exporter TauE/SafE family protein [Filomicrobium]MCV0370533.1 sulfite exporter TauE/SafE family protein [Filomicrobium sp.]CFX08172.1 conserved membrane protein of unknown function [Candidatus Filomicrobium marinum]CPR16743.1 conserved membrane protein of unknown function [Candidatus Filomicrobium marinum]SDP59601.1 hypothetical protein SAMN04488061_3456 [Filomicrobium insigne]
MWEDILIYVAIGFVAQMVDGAIGMAFGIVSTSVLLSAGVPPVTASACTHAAETFTTAASGIAHWRVGNIDWRLVRRLALPGMIGGALGAYLLSEVPGDVIRPYISVYLFILGVLIILRAARNARSRSNIGHRHLLPLGFFGGFLDAVGGGGWGPMVATTLIGRGAEARYAIGSVNLVEFFVTAVISATFLVTVGLELWPIIAGLVVGGVIAAPFAALATRYLPERLLMIVVGLMVSGLSVLYLIRKLAP